MASTSKTDLRLILFVVSLSVGAAALAALTEREGFVQPGQAPTWTLIVLGALLVAGEYLFVRFRFRGEVNALNLIEAVIAPLIFFFPPVVAVAAVAGAEAVSGVLRRNQPIKAAFNVAQWSLATAVAAGVLTATAPIGVSWGSISALLIAMVALGAVNQSAFVSVVSIAEKKSVVKVLRSLGPIMLAGWGAGLALNATFGVLFVFAMAGHPASALLFAVPMGVLHLAYRGYAGARSDRMRLTGLHGAARVLAEPLDPIDAIGPFLSEVSTVFEAAAASLVLIEDDLLVVYSLKRKQGRAAEAVETSFLRRMDEAFEARVLKHREPLRINAKRNGSDLTETLVAQGWRDCLAAPLLDDGSHVGSLLIFDQAGLEGFDAGELAVLEALARETAGSFAKGKMLRRVLEERRRLSEIVMTTSDGIVSIAPDGTIESWNPAMESITGVSMREAVGRRSLENLISVSDVHGRAIKLEDWSEGLALPREIWLIDRGGRQHRLSCSYSRAVDADGRIGALVVVARDTSTQDELAELRMEAGRLARAAAEQRIVVEQMQQALMPVPLSVPGVEVGVRYLASDPMVPTGGDLYDWICLPSGELQFCVVDVLGHGVGATKHAVSVVHTLRLLATQGCPIEDVIAQAHSILEKQDPDLVATVIVVRYEPSTGRARIAGGGHPPALLASETGGVQQIPAAGGPIGWPGGGSISVADIRLEVGDSLILYTDGLIEASKDILAGEESLRRHARTLIGVSAQEAAAELVERAIAEGSRRDDSVALVLRRSLDHASWRRPPVATAVGEIRIELDDWLQTQGVDPRVVSDVLLLSSELLANAVHAARADIGLKAQMIEGSLVIEVHDDGAGDPDLADKGLTVPDLGDEGGRGMFVVRELSKSVDIVSTSEGTIVRCVISLDSPKSFNLESQAPSQQQQRW